MGEVEERDLWPMWLCRQQQDRAVWGSVHPGAILIPWKTQQAPTPHHTPFIIVHLIFCIFCFLLVL